MGYPESNARRTQNNYFRTSMDIGMGIFYAVIGSLIIYARAYGNMKVPAAIAYILGGMMVVGGIFRFTRGIKAILPRKKDTDSSSQ
jgi:hypothetical protein